MAEYNPSDDEVGAHSEEEVDSSNGQWQEYTSESEDESDSDSGERPSNQGRKQQPCKYYNKGSCQKGQSCDYLHICQYHFQGNCKYGSSCKYNHGHVTAPASSQSDDDEDQSSGPPDPYYHWQVRSDMRWLNINHDWVIEAQFSQPGVIGMKIYNTKFGALSIDFKTMRIRGKDVKVRRWKGRDDRWVWFCRLDGHWWAYGEKDSKGKCSSVDSSAIERQYQHNPKSTFQFTVDGTSYQIDFKEMKQTNLKNGTHRKVRRRPLFAGVKPDSASVPLHKLSISGKPVWQFLGDKGQWHSFKQQGQGSSDHLESEYQKTHHGLITYKIGKQDYQLDFTAMTQTNLATGKSRRVQRTTDA
ncbi:protein mono-ADP-ribosyltransferase PARP12-like [Pleurodeles waltl]|uniref:protein mono-ADP-ribosyltransferase PARP12-like n=1 Tax=Pleurodeles waltl TaxID=8319 RepID=UPI0037098545